MPKEGEYMTATQAREYLGITKAKLADLLERKILPWVENPLNKRSKLVRTEDVMRLAALPRPKKLAA